VHATRLPQLTQVDPGCTFRPRTPCPWAGGSARTDLRRASSTPTRYGLAGRLFATPGWPAVRRCNRLRAKFAPAVAPGRSPA